MVTSDDSPVFIDTNVLVYANIAAYPMHSAALQTLQNLIDSGTQLWLSRQVLREFIVSVTRPQTYAQPQPLATVISRIQLFEAQFNIAEDNNQVTAKLLELMQQTAIGGKQIHDANIVATMLTVNVNRLLTHNTQDFQRFSTLITILPLSAP